MTRHPRERGHHLFASVFLSDSGLPMMVGPWYGKTMRKKLVLDVRDPTYDVDASGKLLFQLFLCFSIVGIHELRKVTVLRFR